MQKKEPNNPGESVRKALRSMHDTVEGAVDPLGMAAPIVHAQIAWLSHPQELTERMAALSSDLWRLQWHSIYRALGQPHPDPVRPNPDDQRFADSWWT
ncbi:MAG: alpha/beta hydrolase, partial [Zoogloeaceae bacterium]|nr:alpha/beta hydrolase [Zoogloeaceae bacterium]